MSLKNFNDIKERRPARGLRGHGSRAYACEEGRWKDSGRPQKLGDQIQRELAELIAARAERSARRHGHDHRGRGLARPVARQGVLHAPRPKHRLEETLQRPEARAPGFLRSQLAKRIQAPHHARAALRATTSRSERGDRLSRLIDAAPKHAASDRRRAAARQAARRQLQRRAAGGQAALRAPRRRATPARSIRSPPACCRLLRRGDQVRGLLLDADKGYRADAASSARRRPPATPKARSSRRAPCRVSTRRASTRRCSASAARSSRCRRCIRRSSTTACRSTSTRARGESRARSRAACAIRELELLGSRAASPGAARRAAARAPTSARWPRTSARRSAAARTSPRCGAPASGRFRSSDAVTLDALAAMAPARAHGAAAARRRAAGRACRARELDAAAEAAPAQRPGACNSSDVGEGVCAVYGPGRAP